MTMLQQLLTLIAKFHLTSSVITTWGIIAFIAVFLLVCTQKLALKPGVLQTILESIVMLMQNAVAAVLPEHVQLVFPFIGSLWIFILIANLVGIVPGLSSPTADLSVTAGLAILVFLSVHWFGVRAEGWKNYLKHYITPSPLLLPFHLISEITRTLALAVRLFGNMMSLELTALIMLMVAGFLVPVPILMLHIIEACLQTYIFGMLALIYIAGGIQSHELRKTGGSYG